MGPHTTWGGGAQWGIGSAPFPRLRIAASWYQFRKVYERPLSWRLRVAFAVPQICGYALWPATSGLHAGLCVGVELGQYYVKGIGGDPYKSLWASAQLNAPLRLSDEQRFIELQPAVRFPMVRGKFELNGADGANLEIPRIAASMSLFLGLTIR